MDERILAVPPILQGILKQIKENLINAKSQCSLYLGTLIEQTYYATSF